MTENPRNLHIGVAGRFVGTSGMDRLRFGACGDLLEARRGNGGRDGLRPTFLTRPFVPAVEQLNPDIYLPFEPLNENGDRVPAAAFRAMAGASPSHPRGRPADTLAGTLSASLTLTTRHVAGGYQRDAVLSRCSSKRDEWRSATLSLATRDVRSWASHGPVVAPYERF